MPGEQLEYRAFPLQVQQVTDDGVVEGYASTFDRDVMGDVIMPGAFKQTLRSWKARKGLNIPILWQHDSAEPIGGQAPDEAIEDAKGLQVRGRLVLSVERAREARDLARAGVLGGLSIGFTIPNGKQSWDEDEQVRRIHEVKLWEYSLVTWPANEGARISSVKAMDEVRAELHGLVSELREVTALLKTREPQISTRASDGAATERADPVDTSLLALADELRAEVERLGGHRYGW